MSAVKMPGGPVADAVFADLAPRVAKLIEGGHTPGLATVLIGDDEPSARYVGMKMRKAEELGCNSPHVHLPADVTTEQVIDAVQAIAEARGVPMAQIAMAWVLRNPVVTAPIIGATKPHHLHDAAAAVEINLTDEESATLEQHYRVRAAGGF